MLAVDTAVGAEPSHTQYTSSHIGVHIPTLRFCVTAKLTPPNAPVPRIVGSCGPPVLLGEKHGNDTSTK